MSNPSSLSAPVGGPGYPTSTPHRARVPAYGSPDPQALLAALVDHLLPECPLLRRTCRGREPQLLNGIVALVVGDRVEPWGGDGLVDPHGTDICGWCRRVWLARNREKP